MRSAMFQAEVGDDVFGDDPTVIALQERAADLLGKEAGLFVATGTMGNLVSLMAHVPRGGEVIAPAESHVVNDEAANYAVVVGAGMRALSENNQGEMDPTTVVDAIRDPHDPHCALTSLVVVENCHAHTMSRPIPADYLARLRQALPAGLPIHIDGARLFNAAVALNVDVRELVSAADSVTFCLSKGLAAPVGSIVVGSHDFIARARRARKLVGGGMRQAGVLAAAGLVALSGDDDGTVARLAHDHRRARRLAEGLAEVDGIVSPGHLAQPVGQVLDPTRVHTNFVLFAVDGGLERRTAYVHAMAEQGVGLVPYPHGQIRAVTHYGIEDSDIDRVIDLSERVLQAI